MREALQRLTQERLITALPRAGYIIEDMSDEDIQDVFTARFEIEALAAKMAARYITPDELEMLAQNIGQARSLIKTGGVKKVTDLDLEFHAIIYRASRSKTLYRICKDLGDLTMKYRHGLNLEEGLWDQAIQNHETILAALRSKDEARAALAIISHGEQAKARLIDVMKKARSELFEG